MPKLACNGFSMFAAEARAGLEAERGRRLGGMEELIAAATPLWAAASDAEKRLWKDRAKEYKRTAEFSERKRAFRRQRPPPAPVEAAQAPLRAPSRPPAPPLDDTADDEDYDDDFDPGVPMFRPLSSKGRTEPADARGTLLGTEGLAGAAEKKAAGDLSKLRGLLDGLSLEEVKRVRWLSAAVATFGPESGEAPAELALVEWSLESGVLEEYHRLIGPWRLEGRAEEAGRRLAAESHLVPLEGVAGVEEFTMSRRAVLRNVLGRCEPGLAWEKGLRLGLYKEREAEPLDVLASEGGRRLVVGRAAELGRLARAMETLCQAEGVVYEGFPTSPSRFVQLEALVEALGEASGVGPHPPSLASPPSAVSTAGSWEGRGGELVGASEGRWDAVRALHCPFHAPAANAHCALAKGRKDAFAAFRALRQPFRLPFHF